MFIRILTKAGERLYEQTSSKWSQNYPPDSGDIWMREIDCDPCQCRVQRWGNSLSVPCAKLRAFLASTVCKERRASLASVMGDSSASLASDVRKEEHCQCATQGKLGFTSVTCNTLASAECRNTNASLASVADNNTRHLSVHNRDARVTRHHDRPPSPQHLLSFLPSPLPTLQEQLFLSASAHARSGGSRPLAGRCQTLAFECVPLWSKHNTLPLPAHAQPLGHIPRPHLLISRALWVPAWQALRVISRKCLMNRKLVPTRSLALFLARFLQMCFLSSVGFHHHPLPPHPQPPSNHQLTRRCQKIFPRMRWSWWQR